MSTHVTLTSQIEALGLNLHKLLREPVTNAACEGGLNQKQHDILGQAFQKDPDPRTLTAMDGCFFRLSRELSQLEHVHTMRVPRRQVFLETYRRDLLRALDVMERPAFREASDADSPQREVADALHGAFLEAVIRIAEFQASHRAAGR